MSLGNAGVDPGLGNTIVFPQRIYVEDVLNYIWTGHERS